MNKRFEANTLSLNTEKLMLSPYHKSTQKDNLPLAPPITRIDNVELIRKAYRKFLGVLFDENLTWKDLINIREKILKKTLG